MKKRFQELGIAIYNPVRSTLCGPSHAGLDRTQAGACRTAGEGSRMSKPEPLTETVREVGFAFVHGTEMRAACCEASARWTTGRRSRRAGTIWAWTPTWPMAAATGSAATPCSAPRRRGDRTQAAPAALPEPGLQYAEWRHRALVRADPAGGRRRPDDDDHPAFLPRAVRTPVPGRRRGISSCTSSASRRAPEQAGKPTPEGQHHDGVDHVLVLLVGRQNVQSGKTTIQTSTQAAGQLHTDGTARRARWWTTTG